MSKKDFSRLLSRALIDQEFADLLAADPDRAIALEGAKLTAHERTALNGLSPSQFRAAAAILNPDLDADADASVGDSEPSSAMAEPAALSPDQSEEQEEDLSMATGDSNLTHMRLKALEDRLAFFDQQQQHGHLAAGAGDTQMTARLKALEDRLAFFDQQQQHGHLAAAGAATMTTRLKALEDRLAFFDQQQQHGHR